MPASCVLCDRQAKFGNFTLKKCTGPSNRGHLGCRCKYNSQTSELRPEEIHHGYICPGLKFSAHGCMEHRSQLGDGARFERPDSRRQTTKRLLEIQQRQNEVLEGCPVDHDGEEHMSRLSKAVAHNNEELIQIDSCCSFDSDDSMQVDEDQHECTTDRTLTWVGDATAASGPIALSEILFLSFDGKVRLDADVDMKVAMLGGKIFHAPLYIALVTLHTK